jgi:hypothetical protein
MMLLRLRWDNLAISRSPVVTRDGQNGLVFARERKLRSVRACPIRFTNAVTVPKISDSDCLHEFNARRSFIVRVADLFIAPLHFAFRTPSSLKWLTLLLPSFGPLLLCLTVPQMVREQLSQLIADREGNVSLIDAVCALCLQQSRPVGGAYRQILKSHFQL